jgi:hypothetical protein
MAKSIGSGKSLDEMIDQATKMAQAERIIQEDAHLLDEEDPPQSSEETHVLVCPSGADAEEALDSPRAPEDEEMEEAGEEEDEEEKEKEQVEEILQLAPPASFSDPKVYTRGYGPLALDVLDRLLRFMEPTAATPEDFKPEKVFSYSAKVRLVNESMDRASALWREFHEALFLDKKIKFKPKPVGPALDDLLANEDFNCTCAVVHQVVTKCQHHNRAHIDMCRREALKHRPAKLEETKTIETQTEEDKSGGDLRNRLGSTASTAAAGVTLGRAPGFKRGRGRGRGQERGKRIPFRPRDESEDKRRRDLEIERDRLSRELKRREEELRQEEKRFRERSRSARQRSPRRSPPRGSGQRERNYQPAQDRLKDERRKLEDPRRREEAERMAEKTRKEAERMEIVRQEAEKIKRAIERTEAGPSGVLKIKKKPAHGDNALKPDGTTDWANCPVVEAPKGMKAVVVVKDGRWHVTMETN